MINSNLLNKGKILFVDSDEIFLKQLNQDFIHLGYNVLLASTSQAALTILEKEEVDVIISTMRTDGVALLKKAVSKWPDVRRILLTSFADIDTTISAINEGKIHHFLIKPWKKQQIESAIYTSIESKRLNSELRKLNASLVGTLRTHTPDPGEINLELKKSRAITIQAFSNLIKNYYFPFYTLGKNVGNLARSIAQQLKAEEEQINNIYFSGVIFNIGKVSLPIDITTRPLLTLSNEDKINFMEYPKHAAATIASTKIMENVAKILISHREYENGSGYPNHLKGEHIPIGAKILSIAVDYYELQLGLILPEILNAHNAANFIQSHSGVLYDSEVCKAFIAAIDLPLEQTLNS